MLQITTAQMNALATDKLVRTISDILVNVMPHRIPPAPPLREIVSSHIRLGRDYGITGEQGLARFSCLTLIIGETQMKHDSVLHYFLQGPESPDQKSSSS